MRKTPSFFLITSLTLILAGVFSAFGAEAQQVSVPVTFHRQEHNLSCEIASLKTALLAQGLGLSETQLISELAFEQTPKQGNVWGDPNQGFVGSVDGRMFTSGYGVYWDPIAALANRYVHTKILRHSSAAEVAKHVAAGQPVIMWGYYGLGAVRSWQTPEGDPVKAIDGEHTRVVYGFDGSLAAPSRFYLMDPLIGSFSWSTEQFMHNWSGLNHMGVAITHPRWVRVPGDTKIWELSADGKTRRWIISWDAFLERGGSAGSVAIIDKKGISKYSIGLPIT